MFYVLGSEVQMFGESVCHILTAVYTVSAFTSVKGTAMRGSRAGLDAWQATDCYITVTNTLLSFIR